MQRTDRYHNSLGSLDAEVLTALRMLSLDQVEAANSGHPGLPLGAAPIIHAIYTRFLRFDPYDTEWVGRDRFILSAGHGSALLYSALYLFGVDLTVEDLRSFRRLGSKTPGHPEYGHTKGVETTTGPLGQGFATAVGVALGQKLQGNRAAQINPIAIDLLDQKTFVLASDGDLMEGVSHESASLAGNLGLDNLIVLFDSNDITIDGPASQSCRDDVLGRFKSYGWQTYRVDDGNDVEAVTKTLQGAMSEQSAPVLIEVKTVIGAGSPNRAGLSKAHGSPLGKEETLLTKAAYGWSNAPFEVSAETLAALERFKEQRHEERLQWDASIADLDSEIKLLLNEIFTNQPISALPNTSFQTNSKLATRKASREILSEVCCLEARVVGGAADLAESNGVNLELPIIDHSSLDKHSEGKTVHYGVREHAMAASSNGLALVGMRPYCSTFLVFSDYLRPALRLSALMSLPVLYIFTHDSIALGEDGPTHQPVEHLSALRAIPNNLVLRPADANETLSCYRFALGQNSSPTSLILTRQDLEVLAPTEGDWVKEKGARIVHGGSAEDSLVIVATGSEVTLAIAGAKEIERLNDISVRVISVPWRERFLSLEKDSFEQLVPPRCPVIVVEAGIEQGWERLSSRGGFIGMRSFGASGDKDELFAHFGFTTRSISELADQLLVHEPSAVASDLLLATELAALNCQDYVGKGDKNKADHAAVEALRNSLAGAKFRGHVVIGEGAKDEAPMLFEGEVVGSPAPGAEEFDIAVDPLEGTNYAAKGIDGAISVIAVSRRGSMASMPAYYMEKLVTRYGTYDELSLDKPISVNLEIIASHKNVRVDTLTAFVLDKPRHEPVIREMRSLGVRVIQASDGDVLGSLRALLPTDSVDLLYGIGGAPEGVISAATAQSLGGVMLARLSPQTPDEIESLTRWNSSWDTLRYRASDLTAENAIMVATAITSTSILRAPENVATDDLLLHSVVVENGKVKFISRHFKPVIR